MSGVVREFSQLEWKYPPETSSNGDLLNTEPG